MVLFEFLRQNREEIIQLCRGKVLAAGQSKPTSALLDRGLPVFYDELVGVLRREETASTSIATDLASALCETGNIAAEHGKESLRLGYTISQVVHAYGAVCQSITEFAQVRAHEMTPREFHDLNLCLDVAIAEAVTEYEKGRNQNVSDDEIKRMGFFIHELKNSLVTASLAQAMIQAGRVGAAGSTSKLLSGALERIGYLIDRSAAEVHLRANAPLKPTRMRLVDITNEVEATMVVMRNESKNIRLSIDADSSIQLTADRQLVFSALSNLVNNAIKFTKSNGNISVRGRVAGSRILIEVEDECGGIPGGQTEELFKPFVQKDVDKTGMGLGLSLSRRAIELNHGTLTVRDIPGKGCIFTISLPVLASAAADQPGSDSISSPPADERAA